MRRPCSGLIPATALALLLATGCPTEEEPLPGDGLLDASEFTRLVDTGIDDRANSYPWAHILDNTPTRPAGYPPPCRTPAGKACRVYPTSPASPATGFTLANLAGPLENPGTAQ